MITTKQELLEKLKEHFNNDSRITDEILFNDRQLTNTGFALCRQLIVDSCSNDMTKPIFDTELSFVKKDTWAMEFTRSNFHTWNEYNKYCENQFQETLLPKLKPKLDSFVGDTGCWFARTDQMGNRDLFFMIISPNLVALDMLDTDYDKFSYIFD